MVNVEAFDTAKKMSRKMKGSFPLVPLEDLESEALVYLLESKEENPKLQYVSEEWKLYHYALTYVTGMRECIGDAVTWLTEVMTLDVQYRHFLIETTIIMKLDAANNLSEEALQVFNNVLNEELLVSRKESRYSTKSKALVIDNLIDSGWGVQHSRNTVNEIRDWWRSYNGM